MIIIGKSRSWITVTKLLSLLTLIGLSHLNIYCNPNSMICKYRENNIPDKDSIPIIKIHPNPSNGFFIIEISNITDYEPFVFDIYNCVGQYVIEVAAYKDGDSYKGNVNFANYPRGIYFIKTKVSNRYYLKTVSIQ